MLLSSVQNLGNVCIGEILERQRGLEKDGDAKSTFYISRILLSKISKLCVCLK